ncbi:hypothetical protein ACWGDE_29680 [Streptomyces sp. NPDC054956]
MRRLRTPALAAALLFAATGLTTSAARATDAPSRPTVRVQHTRVESGFRSVGPGAEEYVPAKCPDGTNYSGGGGRTLGPNVFLTGTDGDQGSWEGHAVNLGEETGYLEAQAICVPQATYESTHLEEHIQVGETRASWADCPAGQVPSGGGGTAIGGRLFLSDSYSDGVRWWVRGTRMGGTFGSLNAEANCSSYPHTVRQGFSANVAARGGVATARAFCNANEVPSGGGGFSSGYYVFINDSVPDGNGWRVRMTNTGAIAQKITAQVICVVP